MSGVWDPIGICAGVLLKGKLIFQSITRLGYRWDQPINNDELKETWEKWTKEMKECENVIISRSILPLEQLKKDELHCELVGFCDGSNVGYASVIYLRWRNHDESIVDVKFLGAKAKVASIRGNTTPRNELCGALTLSRLTGLLWKLSKEAKYRCI